ncbi:MAG: glycosyltransferase family 2 protein [Acidimicrobiales bacterium]
MPSVGVVIVTYNNDRTLLRSLEALLGGSRPPDEVVVVDNASSDGRPLEAAERLDELIRVVREPSNLGFCATNNVGYQALGEHPHVLFLNPDAFVTATFLADAIGRLEREPTIGAVGPKLSGFDVTSSAPTGRIDSTGIYQTAYGRYYDRGRGEVDRGQYDGPPADVPALCAAAMLCRRAALDDVAPPDGAVFDESFFMYKEDIDLSLRLRRHGWRLVVDPSLVVYHCRGSSGDRRTMPAWARRRSVGNEWRIWRKGLLPWRRRVPTLGYLVVKSILVRAGF